jgi:hypothetical protein
VEEPQQSASDGDARRNVDPEAVELRRGIRVDPERNQQEDQPDPDRDDRRPAATSRDEVDDEERARPGCRHDEQREAEVAQREKRSRRGDELEEQQGRAEARERRVTEVVEPAEPVLERADEDRECDDGAQRQQPGDDALPRPPGGKGADDEDRKDERRPADERGLLVLVAEGDEQPHDGE